MSTDINTSTSNVSTSTLNVPTLAKRFGLIAMIAVLALIMGGKLTNALSTSPSSGGSNHSAFVGYGYGSSTSVPGGATTVTVGAGTTAGSIKVSWVNPNFNGAVVTSFTVANPDNTVTLCTTTNIGTAGNANSCTWTPTSGSYYAGLIDVFANYATGSTIDTTGTARIQVLEKQTISSVTVGSGSIKVNFTAATASAYDATATYALAATSYSVFNGTTQVCTTTTAALGYCKILNASAGLVAGNEYHFTLVANNAGGASANSDVYPVANATGVVAINPPSAPQNVVATVDYPTGTVDLTFTAPATNGGHAISTSTGYSYALNGVKAVSADCSTSASATSRTCTIALTDIVLSGGTFTGFITVTASNTVGTSSANSNTITANGVAAAPGAVTLGVGSSATSAVAHWSAVVDVTGNSVQGYVVQLETCNSATVATATCVASGSPVFVQGIGSGTLTYTFTGLSYGKIYSVAVSALNGSGTGGVSSIESESDGSETTFYDLSLSSATPTLSSTPVTVTSYTNSSVTASFVAPVALNGSTVTGYSFKLQSCAGFTNCPVGSTKTATAPGSITWTGLLPNTYYQILETVTFTKADGTSSTTTGTSSIVTVGGFPAGTTLKYTSTGATISWTAAATANTLSSYTVLAGSVVLCTAVTGATSCTATTAQLTAAYALSQTAITMYSTDASGVNSALSGTIATLAATSAPTNVLAYSDASVVSGATAGNIDVSWTAAGDASANTTYTITALGSDGTSISVTTANTDYVFKSSVLVAPKYTFKVAANGPTGSSAYVAQTGNLAAYTATLAPASIPTATSVASPGNADTGNTSTLSYAIKATIAATTGSAAVAGGWAGLTPTAVGNGGAAGITFAIDMGSSTAIGNPIQSATGTLTLATGKTLVCTLPASSFNSISSLVYGAVYGAQITAGASTTTAAAAAAGAMAAYNAGNAGANAYYYYATCLYVGIVAGSSYSFSVTVNGALASSAAATTTLVDTATSGPVTALTATDTGLGYAKVAWTAPVTTAPVTGYKVVVTNTTKGIPVVCSTTSGGSTYDTPGTQASPNTQAWCYFNVTKGYSYSVSVAAYEQLSGTLVNLNSTTTATTTLTAYSAPSAPSAPVAAVYSGSTNGTSKLISVTWTAVSDPVGINYYTVTPSVQASSCTTGTTEQASSANSWVSAKIYSASGAALLTKLICTFPTASVPVTFKVSATNDIGTGYNSPVSNSVLTADIPTKVANAYYLAAATGAGYTITWDASSKATSYKVLVKTGTGISTTSTVGTYTVTAPTTSFAIPASDLVLNGTYTFRVIACNTAGCDYNSGAAGTAGNPLSGTDAVAMTIPDAPTVYLYRTSSAATTATLAWTPGTVTGDTAVTYSVYATSNGLTTTLASGLTTTSYVIATYAAATAPTYSVAAINAVGASTPSANTLGTNVSATFTGATVPTGASEYTGGTGPVATGLYAGTAATVGFTAVIGDAGNNGTGTNIPYSVTVTLTSVGGSPVQTCTSGLIGSARAVDNASVTYDATSTYHCTFVGLTPNTVYKYSISETSQLGSQLIPATGQFTTFTPAPGAPTITSATAAVTAVAATTSYNYSVTLNWSAPTTVGGAPITGYIAYVSTGAAGTGTVTYCSSVLDASATTCTIKGLTAGTTYYYGVAALNAGGLGTIAAGITIPGSSDQLPYVVASSAAQAPIKVLNVQDSTSMLTYPAYGSVTATWSPSGMTAAGAVDLTNALLSLPITGYTCTAVYGGVTTTITVAATANSCTFTGLKNYAYVINVYANNAYGFTSTSGTSPALTETAVPQAPSAHANFGAASVVSGTISVQWIAPIALTLGKAPLVAPDTLPVTSYTATATDAAGKSFSCTVTTGTLCTITGLANSTSYDVVLTPMTDLGAPTTVQHLTVKTIAASAAQAPTIVGAVRNANGLAITWTAPASVGSGQLVGYFVTATDPLTTQQYTCGYNATYGLLLAPAVTCSIAGLTVGNSYNISVTAVTKDGAGTTQLSTPATKTGVVYNTLAPEPVMATFLAVTAKQKSVSALSANAKTSLASLISSINDGAQITITGYGTTKAIALARANAAANYLFNNGAAVHVTVKSVISKTIKTALVTVTQN